MSRDNPARCRLIRFQFASVEGFVSNWMRQATALVPVSALDRQLGRAREPCPNAARVASWDRMFRKHAELTRPRGLRSRCWPVRRWADDQPRPIQKIGPPGLEQPGRTIFHVHLRVAQSRRAASPALFFEQPQSHAMAPLVSFRMASCGASRKGTRCVSMPRMAPRATRLTPPCVTATVSRSSASSHAATRTCRSQ